MDGLSVYTESRTQTAVACEISWSVARCSTDVLGAPLSAPVASRALGNCATGRETGFPSIGPAGPLSMAQTERRPEEATSGSFFSFAQVHWDKSGTCLSLPAKDSGRTKSFPR